MHQKYIETSQINNIPGPDIMKRVESDIKEYEDKRYKLRNKYNLNNKNENNKIDILQDLEKKSLIIQKMLRGSLIRKKGKKFIKNIKKNNKIKII